MNELALRQFRSDGCWSYLLWDRNARESVIIDPCVSLMVDYRTFIAENGLKVVAAIDTQLHPDRLSATYLFRMEYQAPVCMSSATASLRPDRKLKDGDAVQFGARSLKVLAAPGLPEAISLISDGFIFTGHVLPLGGHAPVEGDPSALFGIWKELAKFPGETLVFPARDSGEILFSTIAVEKERNPYLRLRSVEELAAREDESRIRSTADRETCLGFNGEREPALVPLLDPGEGTPSDVSSLPSISAPKLAKKLKGQDFLLIDVRDTAEFQGGHIPKSLSLPISDLPFRFRELDRGKKLYVISLSGVRGDWRGPAATRTLAHLGFPDVSTVEGGIRGWIQQGYRLDSTP